MPLDKQTIILLIAIASTLDIIMLLAQYLLNSKFKGLSFWIASYTLFAASQYITLFKLNIGYTATIILSDILLAWGFVFVASGFREFFEYPRSTRLFAAHLLSIAVFAALFYFHGNENLEQAGLMLLIALACADSSYSLYRRYKETTNRTVLAILILIASYGSLFLWQSIIDLIYLNRIYGESQTLLPFIYVASFIMLSIAMFCFVLLLNLKLVNDLNISQRKLSTNEAILLSAQEVAHMGSYIFDIKTCAWTTSPSMRQICHIEPANDNLEHWLSMIAAEHRELMIQKFRQVKELGGSMDGDYKIILPDGQEKWLLSSAKRVDDASGNPLMILGTIQDITQRKAQEKLLVEMKNHFELLFDHSPDAVLISRLPEGVIVNVNKAFERLSGFTREEAVGSSTIKLDLWEHHHERDTFLQIMRSQGYCSNFESTFRPRSRKLRTCTVNGALINISGIPHIISITRDITDEKISEQRLEESAETFSKIFYTNPSICSIHEPDSGVITDVNTSFSSYLGFTREEAIGRTLQELGLLSNYEDRKLQKLVNEEGTIQDEELEFKAKNGRIRVVMVSTQPIFLRNRKYHFLVAYDITERKLQEERLRELHLQLRNRADELANTNKELEQFAYIASHDLQEPLRMIQSFLELLRKRYQPMLDENGQKYIQFAVDGAARLKATILDLLAYSRSGNEQAEAEWVDMNKLMEETSSFYQFTITEKEAQITWDPLPVLKTVKLHMTQVLQNLVGNALKYAQQDIPAHIHVSAKATQHHWLFSIKDNGIGIEEKFYTKIFQVFQRLHQPQEYGGTGIGLSICKKIIEKKGGKIWVESVPGKGSVFFFTLPRTEAAERTTLNTL